MISKNLTELRLPVPSLTARISLRPRSLSRVRSQICAADLACFSRHKPFAPILFVTPADCPLSRWIRPRHRKRKHIKVHNVRFSSNKTYARYVIISFD